MLKLNQVGPKPPNKVKKANKNVENKLHKIKNLQDSSVTKKKKSQNKKSEKLSATMLAAATLKGENASVKGKSVGNAKKPKLMPKIIEKEENKNKTTEQNVITSTTLTAKKKKKKSAAKSNAIGGATENRSQDKEKDIKAAKKAMKKNKKLKKRNKGKKISKKPSKPHQRIFEPLPFDEEKFEAITNVENIEKFSKILKKAAEVAVTKKKGIFSDYRYLLDVTCFKIPSCPKRMVKLNLKHSLLNGDDDDILIIVPDLQRGAKVDYEPTIQHYEDLFREAGVRPLTIMPFNQLRKEYSSFEALRKLSATYDYFLCDGRLVGQAAGFVGKTFQKSRCVLYAVRLDDSSKIKNEIDKSLKRTSYRQLSKGNLVTIPIGNHRHTTEQIAQNVSFVVSQLKTEYPGGLANIRSLYLKLDIASESIPIYISTTEPPLEAPFVVGPREERMLKLKKAANEVLSKFNLDKNADLTKLTKNQILHKQKLKEMKKALTIQNKGKEENSEEEDNDADSESKDLNGSEINDDVDDQDEEMEKSENDDDEGDDNEDDEAEIEEPVPLKKPHLMQNFNKKKTTKFAAKKKAH